LGIFPLPTSYLALPAASGADEAMDTLMRGYVPDALPPEWRFYGLALAGDRDGALAALATDGSPLGCYNRFVLSGSPADYAARADVPPGDLALLFEVVAYTLGYCEAPPEPGASDGELRALIMMAWGSAAMERGDIRAAEADIGVALDLARPVSSLLAAQLALTMAETRAERLGPDPIAIQYLREAMELLKGSGLSELYAQVALSLGMRYQEISRSQRGPLLEAAKCYQEALRTFNRVEHPELYALAQNNLALAYLAMPLTEASDQLRMGIAVQALREALTVYTREQYPAQWASARLNQANALQYMPSGNTEGHLAEAVEIYEELLGARDPQADPLGYARILANQGNALAHLGIFDHAVPKLEQARQLFASSGDAEAAAALMDILTEIGTTQEINGSTSAPTV
jgi:tetratricopeptide (TPR) repeat protein